MDLLTHGIMGATLAQCGFQKKLGRQVLLWGALAAMLPDSDVLVETFAEPLAGFKYHRWITHSLWFGPLIGSALGYLFWRGQGRRHPLSLWIFLFVLTLITHPLLDVLTSFGTQLFSPFSDQRCSLDIISVVDIRYTGPLLIALLIGLVLKRPSQQKRVQSISLAAFGLSCAYLVYAVDLHRQSTHQAHQEWYLQHPHEEAYSLRSLPTLFQPYLRHLVVRTQDQICIGAHRVPELNSIRWQCAPQLPNACAATLIKTPMGQRFAWFADQNYRAEVLEEGWVRFHDLRYPVFDRPLQGLWGIEGKCLPEPQVRHYRYKVNFSDQTLEALKSYWKGELRSSN